MVSAKAIVGSLPAQFAIGGVTVAGIAYVSNHINNPTLAGLIAGVPIGLPSAVFVADGKVAAYSTKLVQATLLLILVTSEFWVLLNKFKFSKYKSVGIAMLTWAVVGLIFVFI